MSAPRSPFTWLGLLLLAAGVAVPLLTGLGEPELRSDESIYSYSVERILDTGDWLTPRSIPNDGPFLEKPPLKMWIVAAGMWAGLLPRDEAGLRFFDGLFGAISFLYIFLYARRLSGVAGGLVAVLTVFTIDMLVFDHGLRSNNMEAALLLCYCGGFYHVGRWVESAGRGGAHAWATAGYFVLGFMTKFVAAIFLPLAAVIALAWRTDAVHLIRTRWTSWILPSAGVLLVCAPWFVYESVVNGRLFWDVIFGAHVYQRFTSSVDPAHVHPWYFYYTTTWKALADAGSLTIVGAGLARLAFVAWRGDAWLARLALVWAVVPLALISLGTSKLPHYAYPFWPPLGIGAGMVFVWTLQRLDERFGPAAERALAGLVPRRAGAWSAGSTRTRRVLIGLVVGLIALSAATAIAGQLRIEIGGVVLFRNSSVLRPLFFASVLAWIAGYSRTLSRLLGLSALTLLLPLSAYANRIEKISRVDHPIRAIRDCVNQVHASGVPVGDGVLAASGPVFHHGYYFYLWRSGTYVEAPAFDLDDVLRRLTQPGQQTPVLIAHRDYDTLLALPSDHPALLTRPEDGVALREALTKGAIRFDENIAALLPGPFVPCAARAREAAGSPIWPSAVAGPSVASRRE